MQGRKLTQGGSVYNRATNSSFYQTRCSLGCSTKSLAINSLIFTNSAISSFFSTLLLCGPPVSVNKAMLLKTGLALLLLLLLLLVTFAVNPGFLAQRSKKRCFQGLCRGPSLSDFIYKHNPFPVMHAIVSSQSAAT